MLSVREVAARLGVSPNTVYGLAAPSGPIPCYRIGRRVLFADDDIQEYLEKCRHTEIKREPFGLSSRPIKLQVSAGPSDLRLYFLKLGIKPKMYPGAKKSK